MTLNGNSFFTFKVHIIKHLRLHIPITYCISKFKEAVGKSTFSVVNMSYNAKVPDILHISAKVTMCGHILAATRGFHLFVNGYFSNASARFVYKCCFLLIKNYFIAFTLKNNNINTLSVFS